MLLTLFFISFDQSRPSKSNRFVMHYWIIIVFITDHDLVRAYGRGKTLTLGDTVRGPCQRLGLVSFFRREVTSRREINTKKTQAYPM